MCRQWQWVFMRKPLRNGHDCCLQLAIGLVDVSESMLANVRVRIMGVLHLYDQKGFISDSSKVTRAGYGGVYKHYAFHNLFNTFSSLNQHLAHHSESFPCSRSGFPSEASPC